MDPVLEDDYLTKVGRSFVWQYYNIMNKCPECLYRFYTNFSILRHGSLEIAVGQRTIECRIEQLQYRDCAAKVNELQIYPALDKSIMIIVGGQLLREQSLLEFTQTFILKYHSAKRYSILNDVLTFDNYDGYARFVNSKGVLQSVMVPIMQIPDGINFTEQILTESDSELSDEGNCYMEENTFAHSPPMAYYQQESMYDMENNTLQMSEKSLKTNDSHSSHELTYKFAGCNEATQMSQADLENLMRQEQEQYMAELAMSSTCFIPPEQSSCCSGIVSETDDSLCYLSEPSILHDSNSDSENCYCGDESSVESLSLTQDKVNRLNTAACLKKKQGSIDEPKLDVESTLKKMNELQQRDKDKGNQIKAEDKTANMTIVEKPTLRQSQQKPFVSAPAKVQPQVHLQIQCNKSNFNGTSELGNKNSNSMQQKKIQTKTVTCTTTPNKQENPSRNRRKRISDYYGDNHQLFLGNIPLQATEDDMRKIFEKFGKILELRILSNPPSKMDSKGRSLLNYGFLTFENPESVRKCLEISPFYYPNNLPNGHRINIERKKRRLGSVNNTTNVGLIKCNTKNGVANNVAAKNKMDNRSNSSQSQGRSNSLHTVGNRRRH